MHVSSEGPPPTPHAPLCCEAKGGRGMAVFCHAADNHHVHWKVCDGSSDLTASTQTSTPSRSCAATEAPELWEKFHTEVTEFDEVLFLESCD